MHCAVPENVQDPPHRRDHNFLGLGGRGSVRSKNFKKFTEGWGMGVFEKNPSVGEVWIFSHCGYFHIVEQRCDK